MTEPTNEQIKTTPGQPKKSKKGKLVSLIILAIIASITTMAVAYAISITSISNSTISSIFPNQNLFGVVKNFFGIDLKPIKGQNTSRTNFLLIGKDYGLNTDTIIVLSYYHNTKEFASVSLPRDLLVNDGYGEKKINAVYAEAQGRFTENSNEVAPEQFLANFLSKSLNTEIHYWGRVDIDGLTKVIDVLGGIDINIENSFTDCEFPTENYVPVFDPKTKQKIPYVRPCPGFVKGDERMNSNRALMYARSRKSFDNPLEAIDFARNQRQQKVIEAILKELKKQILNGSLILDTNKLSDLGKVLSNNIITSMPGDEFSSFLKTISSINDININRFELDYNSGIICQSNDGSSYVILCSGNSLSLNGKSNSQKKLQDVIKNLKDSSQISKLYNSQIAVIGNGSDEITKAFNELKDAGFNEQNIILDYNFKQVKRATVNSIEKIYIYIKDNDLKKIFKNSNFNLSNINAELINDLPSQLNVPSSYNQDILILAY